MKPIPICRVLAALLLLPLFACGPDGVVPRRTVIAGRVVDLAEGASGAVLFNTEDPFALKAVWQPVSRPKRMISISYSERPIRPE